MKAKWAITTLPFALVACRPPATDDMATGEELRQVTMPSVPLESPDTTGAFWATNADRDRLMYGLPGKRALFALTCVEGETEKQIQYERLAPADPQAKAVLSLIGNSHVARLPIDAVERQTDEWIWRGSVPADSPDLEVLTGLREVEATVPGAGSVIFNPSTGPGAFIAECRGFVAPIPIVQEDQSEDPA